MTEFIWQMGAFLILILCGSYLFIRYGLRLFYPALNRGYLAVIEKVPLDHKSGSSLLLIRAGEELLLIGVAQGRVSLLKELAPESLLSKTPEDTQPRVPAGGSFIRLMEGLKRGGRQNSPDGGVNR